MLKVVLLKVVGEGINKAKEKFVANNKDDNRVLMRRGARPLVETEMHKVAGGLIPTLLSVIHTTGGDTRLDS